jgi:salicylate hydroxylase
VQVVTDSNVVSYNEAAPSVHTADGREYSADVVVAADGIRSAARSIVLGGEHRPAERTGFAAYRAVVSTERMRDDPETAWLLERPAINVW